jgi:hypothetical protein
VLGRLIKASAVVIGVGLFATGCAVTPVKMGSAAIVGNDRISLATLDTEAANLSQAAKKYPGVVTLTPTQVTQATLTWLIRFQVQEELARQAGITVSPAQAVTALNNVIKSASASAQEQGLTNVTQELILAASGVPPSTSGELGRYEAITNMYLTMAGGNTTAAGNKLDKAECQAAKALNIQVNPQFGQLDYTGLQVVSLPSPVSAPAGPKASASPVATAPACLSSSPPARGWHPGCSAGRPGRRCAPPSWSWLPGAIPSCPPSTRRGSGTGWPRSPRPTRTGLPCGCPCRAPIRRFRPGPG